MSFCQTLQIAPSATRFGWAERQPRCSGRSTCRWRPSSQLRGFATSS